MQKGSKPNGAPRPGNRDQEWTQARNHLRILVGFAAFWLFLLVLVLAEHSRSWARLLPVTGWTFAVYAAYVTWRIIRLKRR